MPSLWGLVGDRFMRSDGSGEDPDDDENESGEPYNPGAYRFVGAQLTADIERLWGTSVLPRWPERLVTEPTPHGAFAETVGVAADFRHGIALTCWFICEGPYSRIDLASAAPYYDRQLKALDDIGCPVDPALFDHLKAAEKKLTRRPRRPRDEDEIAPGLFLTISTGSEQRDGFEHLRDVVTRHRRTWAEQHLHKYLRARWEQDIRACGDAYHRHTADKGKPPTPKQFAKVAATAATRWFAGDLAKLMDALNLPAGDPPAYERRMPADLAGYVVRVKDRIGGQDWNDQDHEQLDDQERTRRLRLAQIADRAPALLQQWEATGELPALKGNLSRFKYELEEAYGPDLEDGWQQLITAVAAVAAEPGGTRVHEPAPAPAAPSPTLAPPQRQTAIPAQADPSVSDEPRRGWRRLLGR